MAHSLSAKKRIRQNLKARMRNRSRRSTLKTVTKRFLTTIRDGNVENAEKQLRETSKTIDQIASKGTIHRNAANRRKSRLAKRLNALKAKAAQA